VVYLPELSEEIDVYCNGQHVGTGKRIRVQRKRR
jgi:hypothetical protein